MSIFFEIDKILREDTNGDVTVADLISELEQLNVPEDYPALHMLTEQAREFSCRAVHHFVERGETTDECTEKQQRKVCS